MFSEGPCDTKDWSNDAENVVLITGINYIIKYLRIERSLNSKTYFTIFTAFAVFWIK